jgi:hypothetical protein
VQPRRWQRLAMAQAPCSVLCSAQHAFDVALQDTAIRQLRGYAALPPAAFAVACEEHNVL